MPPTEKLPPVPAGLGEAAQAILDGVRRRLGAAWDDLSDRDRHLLADCARRAAAFSARTLAGERLPAADWAHVNAQLANIASAAVSVTRGAFWNAVNEALQVAARVVGGVVKTFVGAP